MQKIKPDTEALNAYVDGELDKDSAANVARAVAGDPVMARKVATLTDLRSTLVGSIDIPDLQIDDLVPAVDVGIAGRGSRHGHGKWMAIAACLAGFLAVGAFMYRDMVEQPGPEAWVASVLTTHDLWRLQDAKTNPASLQSANFPPSELTRLVYVPDLTSARLQMAYVNPRHLINGVEFFVAGYVGTRGCKITLAARTTMGVLDENMRDIGNPDLRGIAWNAGPLDYVLMSQGMDDDRFELIAKTVRESSLNHQPVSSKTRVALGISREMSAPCTA